MKFVISSQAILYALCLLTVLFYFVPLSTNADSNIDFSQMSEEELASYVKFINIDQSVKNSTAYWLYLTLDDEGKSTLLKDIDHFNTSDENKIQMKNFFNQPLE
jgi:hypothetical protein